MCSAEFDLQAARMQIYANRKTGFYVKSIFFTLKIDSTDRLL